MDTLWLPEGHHWDLHIEHRESGNAGPFVTDAGWKITWHITVSPWGAVDSMVDVLRAKGAEPHFVIGGRKGRKHPVVVQLVPLNRAGRSLRNNSIPGETNRARNIQIEICANPGRSSGRSLVNMGDDETCELFMLDGTFLADHSTRNIAIDANRDYELPEVCMHAPEDGDDARRELARAFNSGVASWTDDTYKALGNLAELIHHRIPGLPRKVPRSFTSTKRFTDQGFQTVKGYVGHMHVPGNDHIDPTTAFDGQKLLRYVNSAPNNL